jgi:hypothetical protein
MLTGCAADSNDTTGPTGTDPGDGVTSPGPIASEPTATGACALPADRGDLDADIPLPACFERTFTSEEGGLEGTTTTIAFTTEGGVASDINTDMQAAFSDAGWTISDTFEEGFTATKDERTVTAIFFDEDGGSVGFSYAITVP